MSRVGVTLLVAGILTAAGLYLIRYLRWKIEQTSGMAYEGQPKVRRAWPVVQLAVAGALITAACNVVMGWGRVLALQTYEIVTPDLVWMAPLAELIVFLSLAVPFTLLAMFGRRTSAVERLAVLFFVSLATFLSLLRVPELHQYTSLVLALGVGWRLVQVWKNHPTIVRKWAARSGVGLSILFAIGGPIQIWQTRDAWSQSAPSTRRTSSPNVLLIILDTVGANHVSLYGYSRATTPSLDRLARESVVFESAWAPSSWTMSSHASVFTGVPANQLSARWYTPLDRTWPTLAERFQALGYRTAGFTSNMVYTGPATGLSRGFYYYRTHRRSFKQLLWRASLLQTTMFRRLWYGVSLLDRANALLPPDFDIPFQAFHQAKPADLTSQEFLHWQAGVGEVPFFAFINFFDAHDPYISPAPFMRRFNRGEAALDRYDGAIAFVDSQVDLILTALRHRGVFDNTIVVISADHGELFGEHGLHNHGNSLYRELLHVPLLIRAPAKARGGTFIKSVVSLTDLGATILELVGDAHEEFPGQSLVEHWRPGGDAPPRIALSWIEQHGPPRDRTALGELTSLVDETYHYIGRSDGVEELYAYPSDPSESHNLISQDGAGDIVQRMRHAARALDGRQTSGRSRRDPNQRSRH